MAKPLRVSLRQLEYFVAVVDHGTMASAAESCRISQSAISLAIGQLERALEVQLFLRQRAKGLTITDAGRQVLADSRRLLRQAEDLQATARGLGQELGGRLMVACFPTLTPYVMPITLDAFAKAQPGIEIEFVEGSVAELHNLLSEGVCELALMYDIGLAPELTATTLYEVRPHVILPANHRLAGHNPVRLAELAAEPMIMLDLPPSEEMFRSVFAEAGVTPKIARRTVSTEAVRALVASGAGYSLLLQRSASRVSYAGQPFVASEIDEQVSSVAVRLVRHPSARITRRAAAFAEFCVAYLGTLGANTPGAR